MTPTFPSSRLLPGKGAKMQGYGESKALAGIQASGTNGVLTLSRSDKSGLMPSLGSDEQPVALRAGPGVRIHGYGGIYTLERLPLPPEEPLTGPARLEWEVEESWGAVQICTLGYESVITPGSWVVVSAHTYNFTGGSYTETTTASGVTTAYGPDDAAPDACATPGFGSTYNPETDYGDPTGTSTVETLVDPASLVASAVAQLAVWRESTGSQEWARTVWQDVSEEVTPFTALFGTVAMGYTVGSLVRADNLRFRLRNRGAAALRVDCGFYGSGISGGATDITATLDLAPGAYSAWQEVPSIDSDPDKYRTAEIRRVRIGRWRTVA
jgi:hypothetical protein